MVRRIFGEISAKEFVSVQPMNLPSGLIFYLDFKYNNGQFGGSNYSGSSLFGGDGSDLGSTNVAKNGLYGDGRFGYTQPDQNKFIEQSEVKQFNDLPLYMMIYTTMVDIHSSVR